MASHLVKASLENDIGNQLRVFHLDRGQDSRRQILGVWAQRRRARVQEPLRLPGHVHPFPAQETGP
jgi:hypothetical protein